MPDAFELLEKRIHRLERAQRALPVAVAALVLAFVVTAAKNPPTTRAHSFELIDDDGKVRAELTVRDGDPGLYLRDRAGTERIAVSQRPDASGLYIMDPEGVTRIGVAQFSHGGGGFALHGPESKGAAVLYLKGEGSLRFFDAEGNVSNQLLGSRSTRED